MGYVGSYSVYLHLGVRLELEKCPKWPPSVPASSVSYYLVIQLDWWVLRNNILERQVYTVSICQDPACVMLANVPLVKGNYASNPRANVGGTTKV